MKLKKTRALEKGRERKSKFFDCHNNHCATKFGSTQY